MNPNNPIEFADALRQLARMLEEVGASKQAGMIDRLTAVFATTPEGTTAAILKKLTCVETGATTRSHELCRLQDVLRSTSKFATQISSIKFAALLDTLISLLERSESASVDAFVAGAVAKLNAPIGRSRTKRMNIPPREDLVRQYVARLEAQLGEDEFQKVFRELSDESVLTTGEVLAIARAFTGDKPRTAPKALQAIWNRHRTLLGFKAKSASRAGRSAA
jgi:hypothetical protein